MELQNYQTVQLGTMEPSNPEIIKLWNYKTLGALEARVPSRTETIGFTARPGLQYYIWIPVRMVNPQICESIIINNPVSS